MKVIVLVGNQGSGKSTKYKELGGLRISQDDMGKKEHMDNFMSALKSKEPLIVVDRINLTREQRSRYLEPAKERGYSTEIIDITCTPHLAFQRIIHRDNHPTIPKGDAQLTLKILYSYYSSYQKPTSSEADSVVDETTFNPYMLEIHPWGNYLVVGDIHGCFDEFNRLLFDADRMKHGNIDLVISCGDIIDRGPKVAQCLDAFMHGDNNSYMVMGNHENKLLRYLIGNKVKVTHGLKETLEQIEKSNIDKTELALFLMSLPLMIKVGDNYIFHAGLRPDKPIDRQHKEFLLYARKYDPVRKGFDDNPNNKYWFEHLEQPPKGKYFFGHDQHDKMEVAENVFAMDGGCVYGKELRGMIMPQGLPVVVPALKEYCQDKQETGGEVHPSLERFEAEVSSGYINKQEKGDLVLYNYSDRCTYDKRWTPTTMEARGIIFNKHTGECVVRCLKKFFNVGEHESTRIENLPNEPYEIFDKLDGSCGFLRWEGDEAFISTRGSFESDQAKIATSILREKGYDKKLLDLISIKDVTLIFEIIYPENRMNAGARLVCDYGATRDLFLLTAIDRHTGHEYSHTTLNHLAEQIGCPIAKKYDMSLEEVIELKKTLPAEQEGFVIRYYSGLRVKVKGDEYLKIHKVLNNFTPLFIWENMEGGKFDRSLLEHVPEEYRDEFEETIRKLEKKYTSLYTEVVNELVTASEELDIRVLNPEQEDKKKLGMWLSKNGKGNSNLFPFYLGDTKAMNKCLMKMIRPNGNVI